MPTGVSNLRPLTLSVFFFFKSDSSYFQLGRGMVLLRSVTILLLAVKQY